MSDQNLTRRHFVGIAAVGAATLATGLAGCSSGSGAASSAPEEAQSASSSPAAASSSSVPEESMEAEMARPEVAVDPDRLLQLDTEARALRETLEAYYLRWESLAE